MTLFEFNFFKKIFGFILISLKSISKSLKKVSNFIKSFSGIVVISSISFIDKFKFLFVSYKFKNSFEDEGIFISKLVHSCNNVNRLFGYKFKKFENKRYLLLLKYFFSIVNNK